TRDSIGFTEFVDVPNIRPEVRARRMSANSSSTKLLDEVQWYGLRGRLSSSPTAYPDVTTMAITVAGGDRLAAQVERQVSGYATRLLPPLQGGALAATRDIAPWVK